MKVTLRELDAEAQRVFGPDTWEVSEEQIPPWCIAIVAKKRGDILFCGASKQGTRRLALACLQSMQPVEVSRA